MIIYNYMWDVIVRSTIYNPIKNIKCSEMAKYLKNYKFYKKNVLNIKVVKFKMAQPLHQFDFGWRRQGRVKS